MEENIEQSPVENTVQDESNVTEVEQTEVSQEDKASKSNVQKRFDRMTKKLAEKESEVNYWREMAMSANKQEQAAPEVVKSSDKPLIDNFDNITEYTEALADWKVKQALEQKAIAERQTSIIDNYNKKVEAFKESAPDFVEAVSELGNVPQDIAEFCYESDNGPQIAYHLANNPDEYSRIMKLSNHRRAIALGEIERNLSKQKQTRPEPMAKVSNNSKPSVQKQTSYAEWKASRVSQLKK